jgi:DNA-binding GntR family transcriptional regulator
LTSSDVLGAVDRLAERLRIEVRTGALPPGGELTIREVGERHQACFEVVDAAVARLVSEGVLARVGRSVLAPPLDGQELHQIFRARRELEPDFMVAGIRRYAVADIDEIEGVALALRDEATRARAALAVDAFIRQTVLATANGWEARALRMSWHTLRRYIDIVLRCVVGAEASREGYHLTGRCVDACRGQSPKAIREAFLQALHGYESLMRLTLGFDTGAVGAAARPSLRIVGNDAGAHPQGGGGAAVSVGVVSVGVASNAADTRCPAPSGR